MGYLIHTNLLTFCTSYIPLYLAIQNRLGHIYMSRLWSLHFIVYSKRSHCSEMSSTRHEIVFYTNSYFFVCKYIDTVCKNKLQQIYAMSNKIYLFSFLFFIIIVPNCVHQMDIMISNYYILINNEKNWKWK